jgi:hypothetical protein
MGRDKAGAVDRKLGLTTRPDRASGVTYPSATSSWYAVTTVFRDTSRVAESSREDGSRVPTPICP